ncbi:MAG: hypothetical protein PHO32_10605, partial [Candidatus Cloacimonetes bacterium]|nr:hypothetical protein [Candidatus Cloacimonadota bacterium]
NAETMQELEDNYPNSKYTRALRALQNNQTVRLIDPEEDSQEQTLDNLLGRIVTEPDSAIAGLEQLRNSTYPAVKLAATYRLGWYYSFEAVDTVAAKPYLNAVLEDAQSAEYSVVTRRFFDGKNFLLRNPVMLEKIELDSTATTAMDSINTLRLIPAFMDSLAFSIPPSLVVPDSLRKYLSGSHINNGAASEPDSLIVEELKPPNTTDTKDQAELTPVEKPALPEAPILKEEEPPLE